MAQPLVPLWRYFNLRVVGGGRVFDDAAHAVFVGGEGVAEFPEGVALEVESWRVLEAHWDNI